MESKKKHREEETEDDVSEPEESSGSDHGEAGSRGVGKAPGKSGRKERPPGDEGRGQRPAEAKGKSRAVTIIRIGGRDLDGDLMLKRALAGVSGVSFVMANAISKQSGMGEKRVADLTEDERKRIEDMMSDPGKYGIPKWVFNRRFDPEDGQDRHIVSANLELRRKMDINELKKRKCYRGVRHIIGLPVRGQRTRSSFRKSATVGVSRSKQKPASGKK